jgi:uncharacterized protein (DUF58 family)
MKRLSALKLRSRRRAAGVRVGERKSIRRGQSQEFADHRPYVPGDDLRFLDWHLYARLDSLWVKLFEEESDRTVQLLIDCSASMQGEKLHYARQAAAALSYVALGRSDRVVVAGLNDGLAHYSPSRRGRGAAKALFDSLQTLTATGPTDITRAVAAYPRQRGAGIGLFFTDFLFEEGIEPALKRLLGRGLELHVFHVLAPAEIHPNLSGDLLLVDQESGEELALTANAATLKRYTATVLDWADEIEVTCRRLGVGYSRLITAVPVEDLVMGELRKQGLVS